jgi:hypothetical protein
VGLEFWMDKDAHMALSTDHKQVWKYSDYYEGIEIYRLFGFGI